MGVEVTGWERIGNYAIRFEFSDGHRTGLYSYELLRQLDDVNPDPALAELESAIMGTVNRLGIGTMGFEGRTTLIGCKIGAINRLPASFFVSVAYDCWAFRRLGVVLDASSGAIKQFLSDVEWEDLDYLVFDLPPGTGDIQLTLAQQVPVTGAVIVTTPQDVATLDARKSAKFIEKLGLPVIGIIENMSGMVCPHCGEQIELFGTRVIPLLRKS